MYGVDLFGLFVVMKFLYEFCIFFLGEKKFYIVEKFVFCFCREKIILMKEDGIKVWC